MFGGGVSSGLGGSSVAEKNLDRITIGVAADLGRVHRRARPLLKSDADDGRTIAARRCTRAFDD